MKDNSSEEHKSKKKVKGRKRCTRIENSDSEEENGKINNSKDEDKSSKDIKKKYIKKNNEESEERQKDFKNDKQIELQKKLKFIVNEVREKGKYEYNKQEIPENLKYHSDESDSSEMSGVKKSIVSKKTDKVLNDNNDIDNKNINSYKKQISDRNSERESKLKKSKKIKESSSINSRKKSSNNNSNNKNKEITDFNIEDKDDLKKIKEENEYENLGIKKKEKEKENGNNNKNNNNNINNNSISGRKNIVRKKYSESNNVKDDENNNNSFRKKNSNDSTKIKKIHYNKYSVDIPNSNNKKIISKIDNNNSKKDEENKSIKKENIKNEESEEKKGKNTKLKNLLENKKDILLQKSMDKEKEKEKEKEKIEKEKEKEKKEKNSVSKRRFYKNNKLKEEEITQNNNENENENDNDNDKEKKEEEFQINIKKKNNVRDIIEKLKAKKNEREDLARQEKEAEEESIMRGKSKKNKNNEEKTVEEDTEAEKEAEKIRLKEKRMEERRLAREKRRKMEEEEKRKKEKELEEKKRKEEEKKRKEEERKKKEEEKKRKEEEEEIRKKREKIRKEEEKELKKIKNNEKEHLKEKSRSRRNSDKNEYGNTNFNLPKKVYKDEDEEEIEDENSNSNSNNKYISGKQYKYNTGKKLNKEEEKRRKQLEKDLEDEINKNELSDENDKNKNSNNNYKNKEIIKNEKKEIVVNDIPTNKLDRSFDAVNTYKKPVQKNFVNGKAKIYRPKRPGGVVRGRSHEKVEQHLLNKIDNDQGLNNDNPNYVLTSMNSKKFNGINFSNSPNITYSKKRSIGSIGGENNFLQLNKSFGEYRASGIENGNNFMNGMYNINTLELSSLPDLNSSFDSRMLSYNNNNNFYGLNNDFYNRTAQKNYHNNTINSGNLPNNSNRYTNMNTYFGMNNIGNLSNINGLNYLNGDNDNFINMSNLNINNNNSFFDLRQQQLNPYDLNSSYNIGYNNPLANYPNNQVNLSNILGNNYLGLNNNIPRGISNYNNFQNIFQKKNSSINIEDLLVLEEKLSEISTALNKTKIMHNEVFEFWNYYYNCSLYGSLEKLFTNVMDSNNVQISINYILMSVLICYDCSFDLEILNNVYSVLKDLLNLNHKNLMLIYEHILSKISTESRENIWVLKLLNIVNSSKNSDFNDYNMMNGYSMTLVEKINFNTGIIIQNIRVLLKNYKIPRVEYLTSLFKKINEKSYEDINNFFRQYILRVDNMNGSILASVFLKDNIEFKSEPAPYLHTVNHKPYSLILDLDETLVHFKVNPDNESEGVLKVRPGVMEFLEAVDKYYELIIFTCATQEYANLLIDAIEENKIYFEHRLYRQHTVIIDNDFVKDLTRIGRPLDKIAIVDNMPQNFRLQKENGINIKAFWGEDIYDTALINLSPILINIAEEGGDIRKGLAKYRDEIVEKVTSNISKHNI